MARRRAYAGGWQTQSGRRALPCGEPPPHPTIQIHTEDIMTYLLENRGKISLFSGMNGKVHVALGLFGYLGLNYQF